jgi:AcrR family transcriptional regulator
MAAAALRSKARLAGSSRAGRGSGLRWDAAATRAALLSAGAALFAEDGFDGVTTAAVAARAGVNKALISYHFGGKRGLYQAILASGFAEMAERLKAVEARTPGAGAACWRSGRARGGPTGPVRRRCLAWHRSRRAVLPGRGARRGGSPERMRDGCSAASTRRRCTGARRQPGFRLTEKARAAPSRAACCRQCPISPSS